MSDLAQPDCKLTEPFLIKEDGSLIPWLVDITNQNQFMMSSDKILTIVDPTRKLLDKYESLLE